MLWEGGNWSTYSASGPSATILPVDSASLAQVAAAQSSLDSTAQEIDVNTPWTHPSALDWDSMTFGSRLDGKTPLKSARFLLHIACTSIFSAEPREISLLYVIAYIASAGNETTPGTLGRLNGTNNGAQQNRVEGGTQLLAMKLVEKIGNERIALITPVRRVEKEESGYAVTADGFIVKAKHVVSQCPLRLPPESSTN